jgi:hypothetical protein
MEFNFFFAKRSASRRRRCVCPSLLLHFAALATFLQTAIRDIMLLAAMQSQ